MKVLNFGSMNLDYVYQVDHMVREGETQAANKMELHLGGKGLNQSIALSKAGVPVFMAGTIGEDGDIFIKACEKAGVDTKYIQTIACKNGHTVIQVDQNGQNSILLYGGSNQQQSRDWIDIVLRDFSKGDFLLLQNEINELSYLIDKAYEKEMSIVLNPSPYNERLELCDFTKISIFVMNEIEGAMMTGKTKYEDILDAMKILYPAAKVVLTVGSAGSYYQDDEECIFQKIYPVKAIDTTAAGDTFTGYFMRGLVEHIPMKETMDLCARASSIAVTREGAAESIPLIEEVLQNRKEDER